MIVWHENLDGLGEFGAPSVIATGSGIPLTVDINGDGSVDVVSSNITGDRFVWYENKGTQVPGDANFDGVVDGIDFNVWKANKFGAEAAWSLGDFNSDGAVDGSDFNVWNDNRFNGQLAADDNDVHKPRTPRSALVPAPASVIFDSNPQVDSAESDFSRLQIGFRIPQSNRNNVQTATHGAPRIQDKANVRSDTRRLTRRLDSLGSNDVDHFFTVIDDSGWDIITGVLLLESEPNQLFFAGIPS